MCATSDAPWDHLHGCDEDLREPGASQSTIPILNKRSTKSPARFPGAGVDRDGLSFDRQKKAV
jgi:hypothetical protein